MKGKIQLEVSINTEKFYKELNAIKEYLPQAYEIASRYGFSKRKVRRAIAHLVKMHIDLSTFENISVEEAAEKLKGCKDALQE